MIDRVNPSVCCLYPSVLLPTACVLGYFACMLAIFLLLLVAPTCCPAHYSTSCFPRSGQYCLLPIAYFSTAYSLMSDLLPATFSLLTASYCKCMMPTVYCLYCIMPTGNSLLFPLSATCYPFQAVYCHAYCQLVIYLLSFPGCLLPCLLPALSTIFAAAMYSLQLMS